MDIKIPAGKIVLGNQPLVIIGPNGVGKTRLGVAITRANKNTERVAALRNVEVPDIPMQRFAQANQSVKDALQQVLDAHWRQSFELQNLLSEIIAEDRENAVAYRKQHQQNPGSMPEEKLTNTRLRKMVEVWNRHFPGRVIKIDYEPTVERTDGANKVAYPIAQMSEGERTALYLAARVVSCRGVVMVVDEPETFFHPLLARGLWDDLESIAPNIRFVYITHDIPFALSRRGAQFAIARSENSVELLPPTSSLPAEIISQVFGAASFSVSASRLVFCEGTPDSFDNHILGAWHTCPNTAVVAVGGCDDVRNCVSVFRAGKVTGGLDAYGYIDRDGWPDTFLSSDPFVKAQPVSEIEGFLCKQSIFEALAVYNGISAADAAAKYQDLLKAAKDGFKGVLLNKEILNRAKKRVEMELLALTNPIKPDPDMNKVRTSFEAVQPKEGWGGYLASVFKDEEKRLAEAINGTPEEFLRDFPAKSYYGLAANKLNMEPIALIRTMCLALQLTDEKAAGDTRLRVLRDAFVSAMEPFMWPRRV